MQRVIELTVLLLVIACLSPCLAVIAPDNKSIGETSETRTDAPETVAILPWTFENGTPGAQIAAKEFLEMALTKSQFFVEDSFQIIPEERVTQTWTKDMGLDLAPEGTQLPRPKDILKLGQKLGVDWVIAGHAVWHTRNVWIGLGPKTKSECTVDIVIVDVKNREMSLDARQVRMESVPKESHLKAAAAIFLGLAGARGLFASTLLVTAVSGSPKTPREQGAAESAIARAIQPWLALHPRHKKIDTGDEQEKQ